jgi:hypothetical protein
VLSDVLASDSAYQPEEPWEALYNIFRNRGSAQFAGMLIRRLIARRWFEAEGVNPTANPLRSPRPHRPGRRCCPSARYAGCSV